MARANGEEKCLVFTWVIENFSVFLRSDNGFLEMENSEWTMAFFIENERNREIGLYMNRSPSSLNRDKFDVSFVSTSGEVALKKQKNDTHFLKFFIDKNAMFGEEGKLNLPQETLTVYCKMRGVKIPNFHIRSVLHKVKWDIDAFSWDEHCDTFFVENENIQIFINLIESTKFGGTHTHTVYVGKVPNGKYFHYFVDCKLNTKHTLVMTGRSCSLAEWFFDIRVSEENRTKEKNSLQLECVIAVHSEMPPQTSTSEIVRNAAPNTLASDLLCLLKDDTLSDATLRTEGRSFPVHRAILAARSPVFRAMFEQRDAVEGRSGVVAIDDIDSATMDRMLGFLYGDDSIVNVSWEEASALYYAADKYDVPFLKNECVEILKAGLTVVNVCSAIALADKHSDEQLLKSAVDFILRHEEVVSSAEWENLEADNCRLTSKILRELFVRRRENINI